MIEFLIFSILVLKIHNYTNHTPIRRLNKIEQEIFKLSGQYLDKLSMSAPKRFIGTPTTRIKLWHLQIKIPQNLSGSMLPQILVSCSWQENYSAKV